MTQGPEFVMAMAVIAVAGVTVIKVASAFAHRIAGRGASPAELDALKDEVAHLRAEMDEVHERVAGVDELQNRLDFAERVIGQLKGKPALPGGSS